MPKCATCGNTKGLFEMAGAGLCKKCKGEMLKAERGKDPEQEAIKEQKLEEAAKVVSLTTAFHVAGREVDHEIEIISAECALGMNVFKDLMANARDLFGGRSKVTQDALRNARQTAMLELRKEAVRVGADAVIGIDLDYLEMGTGSSTTMFLVSANGTAVKLK